MSLLMDALRKAEEAKRAAALGSSATLENSGMAVEPAANATLSLTPLDLPDAPLSPATEEPSIAAEVAAAPAAKTTRGPALTLNEPVDRSNAQNLFAAKHPVKAGGDRVFLLALMGIALLALLGIGTYVWWQMQPRSLMARPAVAPPLPAAAMPLTQQPLQAAPATITPPITAPAPMAAVSDETPLSHPHPKQTESNATASPIQITRNRQTVNPLLQQGYEALQQGRLAAAQQAYERMLASDPRNLDALYGLAAIAVAQQRADVAEAYYKRILDLDPRDPIGQAGLADLGGRSAGSATESRLKTLIAEQPNVAALHFALGNLYAQSQRWRDAQQAYFQAYRNDADSPDIAFNLAVSLDQLHQGKLAMQYYGEALRLNNSRPAAFNRAQVETRLHDLQGSEAP